MAQAGVLYGGEGDERGLLAKMQWVVERVIHGFARDLPWAIRLLDDLRGVRLSLADSPATRAAFPFPFELVLELRLAPSALAITANKPGSAKPSPIPATMHRATQRVR